MPLGWQLLVEAQRTDLSSAASDQLAPGFPLIVVVVVLLLLPLLLLLVVWVLLLLLLLLWDSLSLSR